MVNPVRRAISIAITILLLAMFSATAYSQDVSRALIVINSDGTIDVFLTIYMDASSELVASIDLPVKPIPGSVSVSPVDVIAQPLPNDTLAILKPRGVSKIDISYIGSINVSGGIIGAVITYPQWADNVTIRIHRNIALVSVPTNITTINIFGEYVIVGLAKGSRWDLEYTVAQPPTTPTGGTVPATTAQEIATAPAFAPPILMIVAIAGAGALAAVVIIFMRRSRREEPGYLDSTDREILRTIEKLGEASARDIMSYTNLPRTTLYRRLNKMISLGIIGTKAKGGITYYYMLKKPD